MKLACIVLGHKLPQGWCGSRPYLKIKTVITDGIGCEHARLFARCDRCDEEYHVANVHLPNTREPKP